MKIKALKKTLSVILSLNLLLQSAIPFFVTPVFADEPTPEVTPTIEATPTSEPTPIITPEETPTPTVEVTPTVEPTPETTPIVTQSPVSSQDSQTAPSENNSQESSSELVTTSTTTTLPESLTVTAQIEKTASQVSTPVLATDKSDYFPTDTVYITGKDFLSNTTYTLNISSLDTPIFIYKPEVTTDENGSFSFSFTLDGNYRPNYTILAIDGNEKTIATYSFTDSWDHDDDHGCDHSCDKPDLKIVKTNDTGDSLVLGESFYWTLDVTTDNKDVSFPNNNVFVKDELPSGVNYSSVSLYL